MSLSTASRVFQPSPAPTPLLEAVRQRQSDAAETLLGHWVHRHGLSGLDRFRAQVLIPQLGNEADAWFQALLEQEATPLGADLSVAAAPADQVAAERALSPADDLGADASAPPLREPGGAPQRDGPVQAGLDLQARAEAAVDAAFAALEHSFPGAGLNLSDPHPWKASPQDPPSQAMPEPGLGDQEPPAAPMAAEPRELAAMGGEDSHRPAGFSALWQRLDRQRAQGLRQLRGVLRDCIQETVSPLRGAQPQEPEVPEGETDRGTALITPPPQAMQLPDPALSEPALPDPAPPAPVSLLERLTRVQPPQQGRPPAPAPAALSDLRSWLPESRDLPRAS